MAEPRLVSAPARGLRRVVTLGAAGTFPAPSVEPGEAASGELDGIRRFEDPRGVFGVLYCGSSDEAAYGDDIAQYRPRERKGRTLRDLLTDYFGAGEPDPVEPVPGELPSSYFENRVVETILPRDDAVFVDLDAPDTLASLDERLGEVLAEHGLSRFDRGVVMGPSRRVTGAIARYFFSLSQHPGFGSLIGLRYTSRFADDWERWAIWNPEHIYVLGDEPGRPVTRDDPSLQAAAARLRIALPPLR